MSPLSAVVGGPAGGGAFPQDFPGDVPVGCRGQEQDQLGDVGGLGEPAGRDARGDAVQDLRRDGIADPFGQGEPGGDDVDQDVILAEFPGLSRRTIIIAQEAAS